jgi:general stress protein 26
MVATMVRGWSWDQVAEHLSGLAHLASADQDGEPHVSIVSPAVVGDAIWIGMFRTSRTARNLAANPRAALVWSSGSEAYVRADAVFVDDPALKERLWEDAWAYDPAGFFERPDHPNYALVRMTPTGATVLTAGPDGPARHRWTP